MIEEELARVKIEERADGWYASIRWQTGQQRVSNALPFASAAEAKVWAEKRMKQLKITKE